MSADPSTVWCAVQHFEEHCKVDSSYTYEGLTKKLAVLDTFIILVGVINHPATHLCQILVNPSTLIVHFW